MARKSKSRKYKPRNEFRRNKSATAQGHYDFVFGETDTHYKSLGLTTHPAAGYTYYALTQNPNPNDKRQSYLKLDVRNTNKKHLNETPEKGWGFAKEDMPVVRHTVKAYKKRTNRKPKNWYVKKRKWNKKNR
ncbi:MAG: hypothetical protein HFJ81_01260 [Clostridia bacterium]|nr:hypothetical protein [Clostridia bacterium]